MRLFFLIQSLQLFWTSDPKCVCNLGCQFAIVYYPVTLSKLVLLYVEFTPLTYCSDSSLHNFPALAQYGYSFTLLNDCSFNH